MSNNFLYDASVMNDMAKEMTEVKNLIEDAYKMSNDLYLGRLMNTTSWGGESYKTMLAFMNLTLQYHGKFTDSNGTSPITQAVEALKEMNSNTERFYDNCQCYKKMME